MGEIRDPGGPSSPQPSKLGGLILPLVLFGLIGLFILVDCLRR